MNVDVFKKQFDDYCNEFANTEEMDIEKHIKMAFKVGDLLRENERLERCLTQLGQDWSNVVDERNCLKEKVEHYKEALTVIANEEYPSIQTNHSAKQFLVKTAEKALEE